MMYGKIYFREEMVGGDGRNFNIKFYEEGCYIFDML